ncbi:MAG: ABC transporter ATP-binding protein [Chloroflexi bacterium]|nr:ABC transporter ATP-binding protein [Chloroflexota bacterium]
MSELDHRFAVRVTGLGKRYRIGLRFDREDSLFLTAARTLAAPVRNFRNLRRLRVFSDDEEPDVIWALRDVGFELERGEVLGVVGRNGAGKSTLLKILSRVTEPTTGTAQMRGRVASLLEIGTGFHPDLTGRENVFLNGTMHGMTRREVAARFDEIVEFAELEQFIDTQVKRYSSGMYVRLAFAVAAHLHPDVLLTDEVLAVGDAQFQQKCLGRMREVAGSGRTVIFVSHNRSAVSSLCTRAIWLENGRMAADGAVDDVLARYHESLLVGTDAELVHRADRQGDGRIRIVGISFRDSSGERMQTATAGSEVDIVLAYESGNERPVRGVSVTLILDSATGHRLATISNDFSGEDFGELPPVGELICSLRLPLTGGTYVWSIKARVGGGLADRVMDAAVLSVDGSEFYPTRRAPDIQAGELLLDYRWAAAEATFARGRESNAGTIGR